MAITAVGFTDTIANEQQWAKMWDAALPNGQVVDSGFTPTVATGTRLISIASGVLLGAGVYVENSASANVTLAANGTGNSRVDIVVLAINWSADTATLTSVAGTAATNPTDPALTQTAGTTWHVPLARVLVRSGVTQIAAADMTDIRPLARTSKLYTPSVTAISISSGAGPRIIATRDIPDPGWPYRIRVSGLVEFAGVATGRGLISANLDGAAIFEGKAPSGNTGPALVPGYLTAVLTGPHTVTLTMQPFNMSEQLASQVGSTFQIEVLPN